MKRFFKTFGGSGKLGCEHVCQGSVCGLGMFGLERYLCDVFSLGGNYPLYCLVEGKVGVIFDRGEGALSL